MSLISDALKTAERQQRSRGGAPAEHPFFDGYFPHGDTRRSALSHRFLFAAGAIAVTAAVTSVSVMRLRAEPTARSHAASATGPATPRLINPERGAAAARDPQAFTASRATPSVWAPRAPRAPDVTPSPEHRAAHHTPAPAIAVAHRPAVAIDSVATSVSTPVPATPAPASVQITVDAGAPRPVDAIMTRALAAQRQGALAEAKDLYDRAIKVGPVSAALYNNYGALLHDMGNSHDAVAMLRLALSLDQTFSSAWVNLGNSEDALGDRGTAVSAYNQALKLDPSSRDAKVGLAWQYIDIGSFLDARRLLADVLRASPDFAPAHYALGQALEGDKDRTGAAHEFSRFLELGGASAKPGLDAEVRAHVAALGKPE